MKVIWQKEYDGESLYDLGRDIDEAFDSAYNPQVKDIPVDKHGIMNGKFTVKIEYEEK